MGLDARGIGLGIDAGGTFTDAVLWDLGEKRVLAKAKALTTYRDLIIGIRGSLCQLPPDLLRSVGVTSLSTTLATNAVVQDCGYKVGLIALSPFDWFVNEIGHDPTIRVPGAVDFTGDVLESLDEDAARAAVDRLLNIEHCAAIVICGYASIHNPEHVLRVREVAVSMTGAPVVCSHEVSRRLNAILRARTAIANARLLPQISKLIGSVQHVLAVMGLPEKLMVVKGDGTPVDAAVARRRPIETILSGPAASVSGARILTGFDDALVMDIGGTTTDCAILEEGEVAISPAGARVGAWTMSVDVADICTTGLGGDSRIDFTRAGGLAIGPIRNIPFCCLASESNIVRRFLEDFDVDHCHEAPNASMLDVLVRTGETDDTGAFTNDERALLEILEDEPLPALKAASLLKMASHRRLPIASLERLGLVKRAGLTPTDALHVSVEFCRWDVGAAQRALELFAAAMYVSPQTLLRNIFALLNRRLFDEVVRREISHEIPELETVPADWTPLLDCAYRASGSFQMRVSLKHPLVAIGAPAQAFAMPLKDRLDARIIVPEHADVANAIGAIGAEIVASRQFIIVPDRPTGYLLYGDEHRVKCADLEQATSIASEMLSTLALQQAREAGAVDPVVSIVVADNTIIASKGETVFLERRVRAKATGPVFSAMNNSGDLVVRP